MQYSQSPCNSSSSPGALFRVWAIVFHPSFALHWWWWWWWWHNGYLPKLSMSMIEHKRLTVRNCHEESISIQTLVVENCKWWHALFAIDLLNLCLLARIYIYGSIKCSTPPQVHNFVEQLMRRYMSGSCESTKLFWLLSLLIYRIIITTKTLKNLSKS